MGCLRDRFGTVFGLILEVFWTDFKTKFGVILEAFFFEKRSFTCMGAHFSKVAMFFVVYLLLAGSSETAVLLAWELNFREFPCNFGCLLWQCKNCKKVWFSCLSLFIFRARTGREEEKTRLRG